jgi:hypothetical protein
MASWAYESVKYAADNREQNGAIRQGVPRVLQDTYLKRKVCRNAGSAAPNPSWTTT